MIFPSKILATWPLVKPKVGRMMTMKIRYQKVFFITAWFSPDLKYRQFERYQRWAE